MTRVLPCALMLISSVLSAAQERKETWQRVYTGEDSIIEINLSKVTFVEYASGKVTFGYHTGRVGFRTVFSKPEALKEKPGVKYKSRLETIEFNCAGNTTRYRLYEATLLDEKGKVIKNPWMGSFCGVERNKTWEHDGKACRGCMYAD